MKTNRTESTISNDLNESWGMDGFIKFILAAALAVIPFHLEHQLSFVVLAVYLLLATLVLKIKFQTLAISTASYVIIVLLPYLFGFLMNELLSCLTPKVLFTYHQGPYEVFLRLFRLFIIWYVSILYFQTTPIKTVIGLLDKLFFPLKLFGVPVTDYLKVVMCIILELKGTGEEMKKSFGERVRSIREGTKGRFTIQVKGISQMIVSLLVNSLEKIDTIQTFVENVNPDDLYHYRFNVSKKDAAAVTSFILLMAVLFMIEKG